MRVPGAVLTVSRTVGQNSDGLALCNGHIHRRQHAFARRRVDVIADHAHDLIACVARIQAHALPDRLFARQKSAHERFVHDCNRTAAHAVAGLEVPAALQRDAHRLEPAWCRGVHPERGPDAGHWSIADGDDAGARTAPGEQPYGRDSSRAYPWYGRRCIAQTLDARTALPGRRARCCGSSSTAGSA